jgi:hypothetical protein
LNFVGQRFADDECGNCFLYMHLLSVCGNLNFVGQSDGILRCIYFYILQEIESEDEDHDDEAEDGAEDEAENEVEAAEPAKKAPAAPKETERQLSKKELKKKELAELDAVLAELGISENPSDAAQDGNTSKCCIIGLSFPIYTLK